jgi:hypothetical protein
MPDKPQAPPSAKQRPSPRKHPSKEPTQDYSSLPQKPIKLKTDVSLPPVLKKGSAKRRNTSKETVPTPKKRKETSTPRKAVQVFDDLSAEAQKLALKAASDAGLEPIAWLEGLIRNTQQNHRAEEVPSNDELLHMLQKIDERLQRIENQRGFWGHFWEQYMNPKGRADK